jgi:hypothetical protein
MSNLLGNVDWAIPFEPLQPKSVQKIAFADQAINECHLFHESGEWKLLEFKQEETETETQKFAHYKEAYGPTYKLFEDRLATLFRSKAAVDPGFLNRFVAFCTGQSYVPDVAAAANSDFKIIVEYNYNEMSDDALPVVHTCSKTIKLPSDAYNADMEKFEEKLTMSMDMSAGIFDMT